MRWRSALWLASLVVALVVSACSNGAPQNTPAPSTEPSATLDLEIGDGGVLPERAGERRETTGDVPHIQLDAVPDPAVNEELRRRAFQLPGVEERASDRSLPGAIGLALTGDVDLARPDVIAGSREFAHIHPDGSLHVWLPLDRAAEVERTKWGELHPWVGRAGFWGGVAMIYTPETLEEVDIAMRIIVDAYNFVTGASLEPTDVP